jgi:hypothetical protein
MNTRNPKDREQSKKFEQQIRRGKKEKRRHLTSSDIHSWNLTKPEMESMLEQLLSQHSGNYVPTRLDQFSLQETNESSGHANEAELHIVARLELSK